MNTMKKILAFAMVVSMVLGCLVISTSAAEKATYVKDGLVAWYDGSNNSNGTQDKSTDLWKDLSGNANHISVAEAYSRGEIQWSDKALIFNDGGAYLRLPTAVVETLESKAYTIEIVTGELEYTATEYITLLSSANDELSVFIRCSGNHAPGGSEPIKLEYKNQDANHDDNRPYMYNAWDAFNGKTLAVTGDLNVQLEGEFKGENTMKKNPDQIGNVFMYSNGTMLAKGKSQHQMTLGGYVYLGHTSEQRAWSGEIYGLRIYDRALTQEELAANAAADVTNYRGETAFEPKQEYDPELDKNYEGFTALTGMRPDIIPFTKDTDMIPLTGFYGSTNLFDYLYPMESDVQWEGAKLMQTEDLETDYDGNTTTAVDFVIMYQAFCSRAGINPLSGAKSNYIVFKVIVEGEFEDFQLTAVGYDKASNDERDFPTGSTFGGIDPELDGQVQYLIYDVEGIFEDCSMLTKLKMQLTGMTVDTTIYLLEVGIFETEEAAEAYTQGIIPELPSEDEDAGNDDAGNTDNGNTDNGNTDNGNTDNGNNNNNNNNNNNTDNGNTDNGNTDNGNTDNGNTDNGNTDNGNTDDKDDGDTTTAAKDDTTTAAPADEGGCASVVGFGAAAVLVAAAAAVVLKKKD